MAGTLSDVRIVLASSSPRRRDLLNMIGISHEIMPADIDETFRRGETPRACAERLAREKGAAVSARVPGALVISADTIVVAGGEVLGKPGSETDAARMLRKLSGTMHKVLTAVAVTSGGRVESDVEAVDVAFRELTEEEILAYIATGEPMDKAGAYGIQGYGATIVEKVSGDFFAVMGLSLALVVRLIGRFGVRYDFQSVSDLASR